MFNGHRFASLHPIVGFATRRSQWGDDASPRLK